MRFILSLLLIACISSCGVSGSNGTVSPTPLSLHVRRDIDTISSDQTIEINAVQQIKDLINPRDTNNLHVNISAFNGIVLVTGEATNAKLRKNVISIVRVIPDVRRVYNEMTISPKESFSIRSNNTSLKTKIKSAINEIIKPPEFDASMIKVETENSVVYLMGIVTQAEGHAVAKKIQHVDGVVKIVTLFEYLD